MLQYQLPFPKWQFLSYVAEHRAIALHGTGDADIALFEPRQSNDLGDFGNRKAVYAAADRIWAMFFSIADRQRYKMSVTNTSVRLAARDRTSHGPFYFFSVTKSALAQQPWRPGVVHFLPRYTFETQPPMTFGELEVHIPQLASLVPVRPLARLVIEPNDFPFLNHVRGHSDAHMSEYAAALQSGRPLPEED